MSEKVTGSHLERKAILYVRQSSMYQVSHNLESQKLQYGMQERLRALGWSNIDVIDDDLGKSASGTVRRRGFERMVADVCLGSVGVVAAREVSRFARNSRDWQQLVEVCRVVDTLLLDEDMVYDARQSNDRLLLGLKGSLNEYELDLFKQRSQEARKQKARRGELGMNAPVGYVNAGNGRREMDPDLRVQQAIRTVFAKFLELGTARQVFMWFVDSGLELPSVRWQETRRTTIWRTPTYHVILRILKHPIYAGAYAWGRTRTTTVFRDGTMQRFFESRAMEDWIVLHRDHHPGYISWKTYELIQDMIRTNAQRCASTDAGAAKKGPALLAGLLRCIRCGRKISVKYTGNNSVLRYVCHRGFASNGDKRCISFGGALVDAAVVEQVMRVIRPAAVEAALLAEQKSKLRHDEAITALELELQARRYEADRAQRQYDEVDPSNRLVAAELERRWNRAIQAVEELGSRIEEERSTQPALAPSAAYALRDLGRDVSAVWNAPGTDVRLQKRILRSLIEEVLVDVDSSAGMILVTVHWKGGVHTELSVARRTSGQTGHRTSPDVIEAIRNLALICKDEGIASWLTRNGLRTGKGNCWTRQHVTGVRHNNDIPVFNAARSATEGWMNLSQAAEYLEADRITLGRMIRRGELPAVKPLAIGPWVLKRDELESPSTQDSLNRMRARQTARKADSEGQLTFNQTDRS